MIVVEASATDDVNTGWRYPFLLHASNLSQGFGALKRLRRDGRRI